MLWLKWSYNCEDIENPLMHGKFFVWSQNFWTQSRHVDDEIVSFIYALHFTCNHSLK